MQLLHVYLLFAVSFRFLHVFAWGVVGHEIVATIAQIYIHPSVYPAMCTILNFTDPRTDHPLCHLAPIAPWADRVRFHMQWSGPLHYIGSIDDHPSEVCAFPGPHGWSGKKDANVLSAMRNTTQLLEQWTKESHSVDHPTANEALKFLVHFMGDLHQPLHLTGRDRGGNSIKVLFGRRHTNLHSLWDTLLIAQAVRETPQKYHRPLSREIEFVLRDTIYDTYIRRILTEGIYDKWAYEVQSWVSCPNTRTQSNTWQRVLTSLRGMTSLASLSEETDDEVLCPFHWATSIHRLNCDVIWLKEFDEPPYSQNLKDSASEWDMDHNCTECDDTISDSPPDARGHLEWLQLDTPKYAGDIQKRLIIEKLLAQGGVRLAAILNYLFADPEGKDYHLWAFQS